MIQTRLFIIRLRNLINGIDSITFSKILYQYYKFHQVSEPKMMNFISKQNKFIKMMIFIKLINSIEVNFSKVMNFLKVLNCSKIMNFIKVWIRFLSDFFLLNIDRPQQNQDNIHNKISFIMPFISSNWRMKWKINSSD